MGKKLVFEKKKTLGKRNRGNNASLLVSISKKSKRSRFTFYNEWHQTISKSGYVVIAVDGNRMYFKEASFQDGWFLSKTNYEGTKCLSINNDKIHKWIEDDGIGTYEFKYDDEVKLYYIEKMKFEKNNKE